MKFSYGSYTEYVHVNGYTQEITFERQGDFNLAKACVLNDLQGVKDAVEIEEANVNAKEAKAESCPILAYAITYSSPEIIKYLIEKGAEINVTRRIPVRPGHSYDMNFLIYQAFEVKNFEALDILIRAGADFDLSYFNNHLLRTSPFESKKALYSILKEISDDLKDNNRTDSLQTNFIYPLYNDIINSQPFAQALTEQREQEAYKRLGLCVGAVTAIAALSYYASPLVAIGTTTCLAAYATYKCFSSDITYNFIKDISIIKEKVSEKAHSFVEAIIDSSEKAISLVRS